MYCLHCNKKINHRSKDCSNKYQKEFEYKTYIEKWKNKQIDGMRGEYQISSYIKTYLFAKYKNKCARCGWDR